MDSLGLDFVADLLMLALSTTAGSDGGLPTAGQSPAAWNAFA